MYHLIRRIISKETSRIYSCSLSSNLRTLNHLRCIPRTISLRSQSTTAQPLTRSDISLGNRSLFNLEHEFRNLDDQIKRRGRIMRRDVEKIYEEVKKTGSNNIHSLLLIRCCGSFLPTEMPERRTALVKEIWNTLQQTGSDLDVSHYNALLSIYLQNNHKFSPTDFLQEMVEKGIEPNRVTYQHLIARYCQEGDMDNAGKILEHMKEKQQAVTETILNSLITGHTRANDIESAKGIFEVMRQAKMEPTGASYTALLCGLAEKGDMEGLNQVLAEARKKEVFISAQQLLEVVQALARGGHEQHVEVILEMLQPSLGIIQHSTNAMLEMANAGQYRTAIKVLTHLQKLYEKVSGVSHILLNQLAAANVALEEILGLCEQLEMKPSSLHHLVESLYLCQRFEDVPTVLETLVQKGHELRNHYFWPLIAHHSNQGNTEGVLQVLELMIQLRCKPSLETWQEYVAPSKPTLEQLQELGMLTNVAFSGLLQHAIRSSELDKAKELLAHPLRSHTLASEQQLIVTISRALRDNDDTEGLVDLVMDLIPLSSREWTSQLLLQLCKDGRQDVLISQLLPRLEAENIKIQPAAKNQLKSLLSKSSPAAAQMMNQIDEDLDDIGESSLDYELQPGMKADVLTGKNENELEEQLALQQARGYTTRRVMVQLILTCAKNKNISRMEELIQELHNPPIVIYLAQMEAYIANNMPDAALRCKAQIQESYPDVHFQSHKIVRLAILLVKNDRVQEALDMLKGVTKLEEQDNRAEENISQLLRLTANKGLVQETKDLFNLLTSEKKLCKITGRVVAPLVQVHLARDDLDKALETFVECQEEYRLCPMSSKLFRKLIEIEDTERLQKIVETCSKAHGEKDTLQTLAMAFLECNQAPKAARILETSGLRANNALLQRNYEHYLVTDKLEVLEKFSEVADPLFDLDTPALYHAIMRGCAARKDHERALNTWTTMQEKQILPLPSTQEVLADLLVACGQPLPFKRPERIISQPRLTTRPEAASAKHVLPKKLSEALEKNQLQELVKQDKHHGLIEQLIQEHDRLSPKSVRYFLKSLADAGKVEDIKLLCKHLSAQDYRTQSYLGLAHLNTGSHLAYLEEIEAGHIPPSHTFITELLTRHPQLEPRVKELAARTQDISIYNAILTAHAFTQRFEEARKMVEEHLKGTDMLVTRALMRRASDLKDVELSRQVVSWLPLTAVPESRQVHVYNVHLRNLAMSGQLKEALQVFAEVKHLSLHPSPLSILVSKLEEAQMDLPPELPQKLEEAKNMSRSSSAQN